MLSLVTAREIVLDHALGGANERKMRRGVNRILLQTTYELVNVGLEFCLVTYGEYGSTYFDRILENPPRTIEELAKPVDFLAEWPAISSQRKRYFIS